MFSLFVSKLLGGRHFGTPRVFLKVSLNSKEVKGGELFIPLKGKRFDGHRFIEEAIEKGALGFLFERGKLSESRLKSLTRRAFAIEVKNTYEALKRLAEYKRKLFQGREVIALTGSAGKTTTKELIGHLLSARFGVYKTPGNFNSLVGLPLSLANADEKADFWVFEMGADRRGNLKNLSSLLKPTLGVITSLGKAHTEGFKTFENLLCAKGEILLPASVKKAVFPKGFENCYKGLVEFYKTPEDTFPVLSYKFLKEGKTLINFGRFEVEIPLLGRGIVKSVQTTLTVLELLNLPVEEFLERFETFKGEWGRMQPLFFEDYLVINDAYNANPLSTKEALLTLSEIEGYRVALLGDMLELGTFEEGEHRKLGRLIDRLPINEVYLYGKAVKYTCEEIKNKKCVYSEDKEKLMELLKKEHPKRGAVYLIKGSRGLKMEDFLTPLAEK